MFYHKDNPTFFEKAVDSITINQGLHPNEVVIVVDGPISGELERVVSIMKVIKCYSV